MAFPAIRSKAVSGSATSQASWSVLMPPTISAGDRIAVALAKNGTGTISAPAGWTRLEQRMSGSNRQLDWWVKTADGTEDGTLVTFTMSTARTWRAASFAVSGAAATFVTYGGDASPTDMRVRISGVTVQVDALILAAGSAAPAMAPFTPPTGWTEESDDEGGSAALVTASETFAGPGTIPAGTEPIAERSFLGLSNDGYARATIAFLDAAANLPPTATFEFRDQIVDVGDVVHVRLSGSDPDGTIASRLVTAIGDNAGDITLAGATTADATFTAPDNPGEVYTFSGTVTDDDAGVSGVVYASVAIRSAGGAEVTVPVAAWVSAG